MADPLPCPKCSVSDVQVQGEYIGYSVYCRNCYDVDCVGDPPRYVSLSMTVHGRTRDEAIEEWNERVKEESDDE